MEWKLRERALGRDIVSDVHTVVDKLQSFDELDNILLMKVFPKSPLTCCPRMTGKWFILVNGSFQVFTSHSKKHAHLILVKRLSRAQHHRHKRHLVLVDNMALCFAVADGSSRGQRPAGAVRKEGGAQPGQEKGKQTTSSHDFGFEFQESS